MPAFIPSGRDPLPVLLLSLENKLNTDGVVIPASDGATTLRTDQDVDTAKLLTEEFRDHVIPDVDLLGMLR